MIREFYENDELSERKGKKNSGLDNSVLFEAVSNKMTGNMIHEKSRS